MITPTTAIIVGAIALIVFGPKQLPELAKGLGKAMGEFKKGLNSHLDDSANSSHGATTPNDKTQT
ncbi:MAG: twin-arginine translocase TatA/TatE family subunit [Cyanobacteria bacterium NC_groundwater_1444_Ag_S-0.65um_54_12]|nr:twin-arginine translocase TatA/TatE family subunit [Cyanobacteria bacterium NC_groundwater_1444_Ag_S-0.65um_54_12]